ADIKAAGCEPVANLDAALPRADFVTIHCPKTPETVGMFNAARLTRMKPTAFLINTARARIIDEPGVDQELAPRAGISDGPAWPQALTTGVIRGAGLDVFDREPIAPENPLPSLPNVLTA